VTEIHGAIPIAQCRPLAKAVTIGHHYYHPDGSTALYDAIRAGVERADKERTPGLEVRQARVQRRKVELQAPVQQPRRQEPAGRLRSKISTL